MKSSNVLFDFKILPLLIIFSTLFLGTGYAAMNVVTREITGTISADTQSGIFISYVDAKESTNSVIACDGSILHSITPLSETDGTSRVTYEVTVYNNSDKTMGYFDATYGPSFYSNPNILFKVTDINKGQKLSPKSSVTFKITFYYKDNMLPDTTVENFNILDAYINFEFKEIYNISYENFTTIPATDKIMAGENLGIQLANDITKVEVYENNKLLTLGTDYTYSNKILTVNNVTGNLLIKNIKQYTITFDARGGSGVSSKVVDFGGKYGSLPTTSRYHYLFTGWYTSATGGTKVTADTIYNTDRNITLYAHWGYGYDYQSSSTLSSISVFRDTEISFDSTEGAVKLLPINTTNDGMSTPYDIGVYLTFGEIDINKYKYIIIGYRVPTSLAYSEQTHTFPMITNTNSEAQPYCTAMSNLQTSDNKICASIFDFSNNSYFNGKMTKIRLDYFNRCNFQNNPIVPYYLYYVMFAETMEEANTIAEAIRESK